MVNVFSSAREETGGSSLPREQLLKIKSRIKEVNPRIKVLYNHLLDLIYSVLIQYADLHDGLCHISNTIRFYIWVLSGFKRNKVI